MNLKSLINKLSLLLLVAPCLVSGSVSDPTAKDGNAEFGGLIQHKPGMKVRITQALSYLIKDNLL